MAVALAVVALLAAIVVACSSVATNESGPPIDAPTAGPAALPIGSWLLTGRIEFVGDDEYDLPARYPTSLCYGELTFEFALTGNELAEWRELHPDQPDARPTDTYSRFFEVGPGGVYQVVVDFSQLPGTAYMKPPHGQWAIELHAYPHKDWHTGLIDMDFSDVPVAANIVAKRSGEAFDLGIARADFGTLFGQKKILTGRILDSTGGPLANSWELPLERGSGKGRLSHDIHTDGAGYFTVYVEKHVEKHFDPSSTEDWRLFCREVYYREDPGMSMTLQKPRAGRHTLDFGDIVVPGAVARFWMKDQRPKSGLAADSWSKVMGEFACAPVSIYPTDGNGSTLLVPYDSREACAWVPAGIYLFNTYFDDGVAKDCTGTVVIPQTGVVSVELPLVLTPFIGVKAVTKNGNEVRGNGTWTTYEGARQVATGKFYSQDVVRIPMQPGQYALLAVSADGYLQRTFRIDAESGPTKVVLADKIQIQTGCIEIAYPEPPEGYTLDQLQPILVVTTATGQEVQWWRAENSKDARPMRIFTTGIGRMNVGVCLGRDYGYDEQIVSGPVEVEVRSDEFTKVELPSISTPPWKHWAKSRANVRLSCGETTVQLRARGITPDGVEKEWEFSSHGYSGYPSPDFPGDAIAIVDGDSTVRIAETPPGEDGADFVRTLALPVRMKLDLSELAPLAPALWVKLQTKGGYVGTETTWRGDSVSLWAPPGPAVLSVGTARNEKPFVPGNEHPFYIAEFQLEADKTVDHRVKAGTDVAMVRFVTAGKVNADGSGQEWRLYRRDAILDPARVSDQRYPGRIAAFIRMGRLLSVETGEYTAIPDDSVDSSLMVPVTITTAAEQTISLPDCGPPPKTGTLRLKFALPEGELVDSNLGMTPVRGNAAFRASPLCNDTGSSRARHRVMPDGMLLVDFPLDRECVIQANITLRDGNKEVLWLLKPLVVRVQAPGTTIEASLVRGVKLDKNWPWIKGVTDLLDGFWLQPFDDMLPVGTHDLVIDAECELLRRKVEFPERDEPFAMPEALAKELEELKSKAAKPPGSGD